MAPPPGSGVSGESSSSPAQNRSQFSQSKQFTASENSSGPGDPRSSAEWLSLNGTEPFPGELFRVPVPNAVFSRMPKMSDSALRSLLSLLHLSYRYDPVEKRWMRPGDWFARSDVEDNADLSSQGTRNGLEELEDLGWVQVDRGGRGFQYQLLLEVPRSKFTFVPTALLEETSTLNSTELRLVLVVLRQTWGWTETTSGPDGVDKTVHARWTRASNADLADATGRSETAVKQAANALQGHWIERVRPGNGSYQYRFLPEAIGDGSGNPDSFCEGSSNDLPPYRQNSAPPSSYKENTPRDKHSQSQSQNETKDEAEHPNEREGALPPGKTPSSEPNKSQPPPSNPSSGLDDPDFTDLSPEAQSLAEKLQNVGIWPNRVAEVLTRFSLGRIRANFELYRRRAAEQNIRSPGAWLYRAITEGYTLPSSPQNQPCEPAYTDKISPPAPEHKQMLSREEMETCIEQGVPKDRFHRCLSDEPGARFMYLDPNIGNPGSQKEQ